MKKISTLSLLTLGACSMIAITASAQLINEGFEGAFPPSGWTIDNPGTDGTWIQGSVGKSGSKSAYIDIFNFPAGGTQPDAFITGPINLSSVTSPTFTLYYAYQMYSDPATYTTADALNVYVSTDGGTTWNSVFNKTGNVLVTAATQFNGSAGYVPTSSEWVMETANISAYASATAALFKIEWVNDWENNPYIDDIMVAGAASVNETNIDSHVSVYPNPSSGNVNVDLAVFDLGQTNVTIYNVVGDVIEQIDYNVINPKRLRFDLDNQPNGVYFVKVKTKTGVATKKLVLNK